MNNGKVEVIEVSKPKRIFANAPRSAESLLNGNEKKRGAVRFK